MSKYSYGDVPQSAGDYVITFGKFKGQKLSNIPIKTLNYYLSWPALREPTRKAIKRWLDLPTNRTN
jgi:hypothetical protein